MYLLMIYMCPCMCPCMCLIIIIITDRFLKNIYNNPWLLLLEYFNTIADISIQSHQSNQLIVSLR